jgi:hypothetical protein
VLFGGYFAVCGATCGGVVNFAETWLWDGTMWLQANPAQSPPARSSATIAYDRDRQRIVLAAGYSQYASGNHLSALPLMDAWEWDGSSWTSLPAPPYNRAVFDPGLRRILLLSSGGDAATLASMPHATQAYGTGCAGTAGTPWITSGSSNLGNPSFALDVGGAPAHAPCLVGLSFTAGSVAIGSCNLLLGPLVTVLTATGSASGFATMPAPIPASPVLRGLVVHAQALVLDAAAPSGFAMTQGLRVTVGD